MSSSQGSKPRLVVVGASSGVGRCFAAQAVATGADVVVVARREAALRELVAEAGGGHVVAADLTAKADRARLARSVGELIGRADLVLFSVGTAPLRPIELQDDDDWAATFAANVSGINLAIAALLPLLSERAIVAVMSSETVGHPRWGLASYGASKAALEESLRCWRIEHPEFRFATIPIGATIPTEFGNAFEQDVLLQAFEKWSAAGLQTEMMQADSVAATILRALLAALPLTDVGVEHLTLRPPYAHAKGADVFLTAAADNNLIS